MRRQDLARFSVVTTMEVAIAVPKLEPVVLSDDERETLERWARRPKSSQALVLRYRIVLECADGGSNSEVGERGGVDRGTVRKWRSRFLTDRIDGLNDEPRPGAPRAIADDDALKVKTLEETPDDATHWSTRPMAKATGMSQSAVSRILRAFGLKPHLVETFELSPDPQFVDKLPDIVGLYVNPRDSALVLCVDEKTQVQALDRTAPVLPLRPRLPERRTHDYVRHGTTDLYAALDVASGQVITDMTDPQEPKVPSLLEPDQPLGSRHPRRPSRRRQRLDPQDT